VRDLRGFVSRESSERPVEANDNDEAVLGVAFAHMLWRLSCVDMAVRCQEIYRGMPSAGAKWLAVGENTDGRGRGKQTTRAERRRPGR
jgi:hypothetical protein